jgi:hypothetical protein
VKGTENSFEALGIINTDYRADLRPTRVDAALLDEN